MTEQERLALLNQQNAANTTATSLATAIAPTTSGASNTSTAQSTGNVESPAKTTPSFNLPGVSDSTKKTLSDLLDTGYQPSATVDTALKELNAIIGAQPGAFNSQYSAQLKQIMDQILGREQFSYDMNADATYQQMKDQYQRAGRTAMMDTMGQAAQLTGGYGSSYASTAGNQAYQGYLTQLNNIVPELRSNALSEYNAQGDRMNNAYNLTSDAYNRDQSEWQDDYNRWLTERNYAAGRYDTERSNDYADYQNQLDLWYNVANQENQQYASDKQYAYNTAMDMLQIGKMPSAALLLSAGISAADAKAIYSKYKPTGSSGSSSSRSSSSGSSSSASSGSSSGASSSGSSSLSDAAVSAKARSAYTAWAKTGAQPNWSAYSAADQKKLNAAFRALRESTV